MRIMFLLVCSLMIAIGCTQEKQGKYEIDYDRRVCCHKCFNANPSPEFYEESVEFCGGPGMASLQVSVFLKDKKNKNWNCGHFRDYFGIKEKTIQPVVDQPLTAAFSSGQLQIIDDGKPWKIIDTRVTTTGEWVIIDSKSRWEKGVGHE